MKKMFTTSIVTSSKMLANKVALLFILIATFVFAGSLQVAAQDASITFPVSSFTSTTVNPGVYNEVKFTQSGCSFSSSSYANCSGFTSGNTLRIDNNTDSFNILTPNSTLNQVVVRIQSNGTSASSLVVGFSNDGTTFTNFQEFAALANNANPSCALYTITAPVNRKYIRLMRTGFGGYTATGAGAGGTVRIFIVQVYVNTVCSAPAIGTPPSTTPQSVCQNASATALTVAATGSGTLSYQWKSSTASDFSAGVTNVGTNSNSYTPSTASVGTLYYRCVVTNDCGGGNTATATSNISGAVTVNGAPAITGQSTAGATYGQGSPASPLSVTATGAGLNYQWYSSTDAATNTPTDIPVGSNSDSYTPSTDDLGTLYYYCIVTGDCSPPVTSTISGAIVIDAACTTPSFIDQPLDFQSECTGGTLSLGPVSTDIAATFQWYVVGSKTNVGGSPVTLGTGGATDTYTPPSTTGGTYYYYVVATNGACTAPSDPVEFIVDVTAITGQSTAAANYTIGATATSLTVTAIGTNLQYQWYSNASAANTGGTIIGGATADSYTPPTGTLGTTYYYCVVTGDCSPNTVTSAVSGAITIVQYATGDFMSKASTSWELNTTWNVWSGSAWVAAGTGVFPNSTTASVYISGGFNVTYPTTDRACKNLYVLDGSLKTGTTITGGNRRYLFVHGTTVEVGPSGTLGSALTGDNADAICIDTKNTGTVTFTGSGGLANFGLIRYSNTSNIIIDRNITLNYHGSSFGGNAMAYHSNGTITNDNTLTINAGKTLTFAPWACYSATSSSGALGVTNLIINVNGTLTMQPFGSAYTPPRGYLNMGVTGAGKTFFINVGSSGVMNLQEFLPNSTGSGTGNTGTLSIAAGGVVNVANETDLRDANTISGGGTFNVLSGATLKIGSAAGITASGATGAVQTTSRTFSTGANYSYEGTAAQAAGDGLPSTVNNLTINNTNGVTLAGNVSVSGVLALTNGKLATGANKVTTAATGSSITGSSSSNYVNGNLERAVAAGASTVAFPVGDGTSYTPVSLAFGAANTSGNVTASASAPGVPPASGFAPTGSGISQTKYINRSWTLTSTISSPDYAATFTYINPADVVGGANTSALLVAKNSGGTWSNPGVASSVAPSVATVSGLTSFSTFYLGEDGCEPVGITSATAFPVGPLCSGQTTDLTANVVVGTNAVVTWYTGPNGTGANLGTGLTLNGVGANTYYARVTGNCGTPQEASVTVNSIANTFTGTGNWTDNARWSCGAPPSSGDAVIIAAGANATLNTNFLVSGSLVMNATSTLIVNPTRTLSVDVAATANFNGQSVTFLSDASGTASLGQVAGTLSGATNVTVERFIPNNGFRSWRLLSVPVTTGQTIRQAWQEGDANPLPKDNNVANRGTQITGVFATQAAAAAAGFDSTSVQAGMLRWNGTGWSNITSTNQSINNFNSYFLYIRGERSQTVTGAINSSSTTTLRTKGTVFTGDQTTSVGASAFALVPNVYPSAINFTGLTRTGGVNNLFYIWDSKKLNGNSLGAYQTFSNTNSFNCMISGGSYTLGSPNTTIESGQSFFVTSGAAGTVVLKESAKVSGTNGGLGFRPSGIKRKIDTRLYNSNEEMLDANAVVFDAAYSKAVSEEDAPKLGNPGTNFAVEADSKLLAIAGTQPVQEGDAIQYRMWNLAQGDYKLEFTTTNLNLPEGVTAMLEDSYLGTSTTIDQDNATTVKFTVDQSAGSSKANRFRVVFAKAKAIAIDTKQGYSIAPNPIENGVMNLVFKNQPSGKYSVRILNTSGQSLSLKTINHAGGNGTQNIILPVMMSKGTYTVEIVNPVKEKTTQIVLIK